MCVPRPSVMPLKAVLLGILSLQKVIPSYFPKTFFNLPELLISLNERFVEPTVLSIVADHCGAVTNVPGMKPNFSPLYRRDMT